MMFADQNLYKKAVEGDLCKGTWSGSVEGRIYADAT